MSETSVQEVEKEVKTVAARAEQSISAEEKLAIREIENEYLKAQMQVQALSQTTQNAQKKFTTIVENLAKKYEVSPTEMQFDNISLKFVAIEKKL